MNTRNILMTCGLLAACQNDPETVLESQLIDVSSCNYNQFGGTPQKGGRICPEIIGKMQVIATVLQDNGAVEEEAQVGFLSVHYGVPLTQGDSVVVPIKRWPGEVNVEDKALQSWGVQTLQWSGSGQSRQLLPVWKFVTDYKPVDVLDGGGFSFVTAGYESLFQPAIANRSVYAPAAHGALVRIDLATGRLITLISPLKGTAFEDDDATITNSSLTVDESGSVYYTVVAWPLGGVLGAQPRGSWLVRVRPDDSITVVPWAEIATPALGVKRFNDLCSYRFGTRGTPTADILPPTVDAVAPQFNCGAQRPIVNLAPTVTSNGDIVVISGANNAIREMYMIRLNGRTLQPIWASSLMGHIFHGCGVLIPYGDSCREGTTLGFDPEFNEPLAFRSQDILESHVVELPDGSLTIAGYLGGLIFGGEMDARGATMRYSAAGQFLNVYDYGWQVTSAVYPHANGTFSIAQDRQKYSDGDLTVALYSPIAPFDVTAQWHNEVIGEDFFDNLDGQVSIDSKGSIYSLDGLGVIYKYGPESEQIEDALVLPAEFSVQLSQDPSRDQYGNLYISYGGTLYVIGSGTEEVSFEGALQHRRDSVKSRHRLPPRPLEVAPPQ